MEVTTHAKSASLNAELVRALRVARRQVAGVVADAFEITPKWRSEAEAHRSSREDYLTTNFHVFADYLIEYFSRDDPTFKHLFVGEAIKALYDADLDDTQAKSQAQCVSLALRQDLETLTRGSLSPGASGMLHEILTDIERTLTADAARTQRVLLVGDCLFLDIVPFIVADLLDEGIRLIPDYATSKNSVVLRDQLRAFSRKSFDLVFYSPFSYEFSPDYAQLSEWRRALMREDAIGDVVQGTWSSTRETIDLLADLFDCPIHVHNSSAVVREESTAKRLVKLKATARLRASAKRKMNDLLARHLQQRNTETFLHLFLFDEDRMVQDVGEFDAGAYFYKSPLQHPATLGRILSVAYADILYVNAWLVKKKVVVCDLDNTLWDGVIGEGAVAHFHDRQTTLKSLKVKGIVLAINSKNDPANVHWRGGTLGDEDFVYAAISWEPKVQGMKRIQAALNLKTKDYAFIDDREDERELMRMTYPDTPCLDATSAATWRRFALWERSLEVDSDMDRTLMYKQREARKAFVKEDASSDEERAQLFASLDLKLAIAEAQPNDLKRVAELINRTNQFNLEGSRTSFKEVGGWHGSPHHLILLGQTSDRFGAMGTTCVAVVRYEAGEMHLLPFVLSCRVFGYGIERAMMNYLKHLAGQRGLQRIVGRYVSTPQNAPCKDFLPENGFIESGGIWSFVVSGESDVPTPEWLAVTVV